MEQYSEKEKYKNKVLSLNEDWNVHTFTVFTQQMLENLYEYDISYTEGIINGLVPLELNRSELRKT